MTKIGLCGTHSSGKTSVLRLLKKEYKNGLNMVSEAARDCPFPINEKTNFKSQEWIFRTQIKREMDSPLDDITISDRTVYDQLAYVMYALDRGNISYEEYKILEHHILTWATTYDAIVYFPIEFPLEDDGVRSKDEKYREAIDLNIRAVLDLYADKTKLFEVRGTPEERAKQVKNIIFGITSENINKGSV